MFLPHPRVKVSIVGSLRDREVACSASDRQGSNFESCVWRTVSSQSSHHPQKVLLAQFSLYVHKGGLKPDSFHFLEIHWGFSLTRFHAKVCVLPCINVKIVLKLACKWSNIILVTHSSCILLLKEETSRSEIFISLMEEERMDHYLFYDLTLTTSCGMANILAFLMCV